MPENTCIALYVSLAPGVALKVTNFERSVFGDTLLFDLWKIYRVEFIDFREYHVQLIAVFRSYDAALRHAREFAEELPF